MTKVFKVTQINLVGKSSEIRSVLCEFNLDDFSEYSRANIVYFFTSLFSGQLSDDDWIEVE